MQEDDAEHAVEHRQAQVCTVCESIIEVGNVNVRLHFATVVPMNLEQSKLLFISNVFLVKHSRFLKIISIYLFVTKHVLIGSTGGGHLLVVFSEAMYFHSCLAEPGERLPEELLLSCL